MGRYLPAIMIAVCGASCFGVEPVVTLPAEVSGDVGAFIRVEAETNGTVVQWFEDEPGLNLFPVDLLKDTRVAVVTASREGKYRLLAYTAIGDMPSRPAVVTIVVGKVPPKPVPPDPDDEDDDVTPDPDEQDNAPFPADGLHVLIIYESEEANGLTADQRAIIFGSEMRRLLDSAAPQKYRIYDKDADLQYVGETWKAAMTVPRQSLPWLAVSNGKAGFSGPLDMSPSDFRKLIEELK